MAHSMNRILEALPANERQKLSPYLKKSILKHQTVLFEPHTEIQTAYFPYDAVVSLVVSLSTGQLVEAAMVGHDGVVGASAILNGPISLNKGVVQLEGGSEHCDVNAIRGVLGECPVLHALLARHEQALFGQAQQSAACNASHVLEARLCRWLLRARDLSGSDNLKLTQEYIAEMLGVRRTSVSIVAHTLQAAGLIRYRRGVIDILNVDGLKQSACECYEAVKANYDALLRRKTHA